MLCLTLDHRQHLADITSLGILALEAPYYMSAKLHLFCLEAIASAERDTREDHLWALREDPGYFADTMQKASKHRQELLMNTGENKRPIVQQRGWPLFWNRVLGNALIESHFGFATCDEILRQIKNLPLVRARYHDRIKAQASKPPGLFLAYQNTRPRLDAAKSRPHSKLADWPLSIPADSTSRFS